MARFYVTIQITLRKLPITEGINFLKPLSHYTTNDNSLDVSFRILQGAILSGQDDICSGEFSTLQMYTMSCTM